MTLDRQGQDTSLLLDREDVAPVLENNIAGRSPFLFCCDHYGRAIPRRLGDLGLPVGELDRHIAWDIGIAGVTERLAEALDATAVLQTYSRLVIDCNRNPTWPTAMPETSEHTTIPGNVGLTQTAREARIAAVFTPYHARITGLLDARAAAGRRTVFVAMHSFTPSFKGESRAMHVGVLYNRDATFADALLRLLCAEPELVVGDNAPYAVTSDSDYGVPVYGEQRGLRHVEIEIRQDLIAEPKGQEAWAALFARLLVAADSLAG
jgi:predicted N-formylglutamate amidohydrolase